MIELTEIKCNELRKAHLMHRKGFIHTFIKYHDKNNPVFMTFSKFKKCYNNPKITMLWIVHNDIKVGQIWIKANETEIEFARLFVIKKYQNKGIAQNAIMLAEQKYPQYDNWYLDTIKQEKNNCHLYEKMGYMPTGKEKVINSKMTIVNYRKSYNCIVREEEIC
ncbi:MAG: GNAT family N-acetyltransferase [Eubacterium sp.]